MKTVTHAYGLSLVPAAMSLLVASAGCRDEYASAPPTTTGANLSMPSATGSTLMTALNDAQIVELVAVVNRAAVEQARWAENHASNPKVRDYAQQVVAARKGMGERIATTAQTQHIARLESERSFELKDEAFTTLESLQTKSGADFDQAYMDAQRRQGQEALDLFDNLIVPNVANGPLRAMVHLARTATADDVQNAKGVLLTIPTTSR